VHNGRYGKLYITATSRHSLFPRTSHTDDCSAQVAAAHHATASIFFSARIAIQALLLGRLQLVAMPPFSLFRWKTRGREFEWQLNENRYSPVVVAL
jgi:hypothetical protein